MFQWHRRMTRQKFFKSPGFLKIITSRCHCIIFSVLKLESLQKSLDLLFLKNVFSQTRPDLSKTSKLQPTKFQVFLGFMIF